MPDPERLLNTLRRATAAFGDTPGRRGHLVETAPFVFTIDGVISTIGSNKNA